MAGGITGGPPLSMLTIASTVKNVLGSLPSSSKEIGSSTPNTSLLNLQLNQTPAKSSPKLISMGNIQIDPTRDPKMKKLAQLASNEGNKTDHNCSKYFWNRLVSAGISKNSKDQDVMKASSYGRGNDPVHYMLDMIDSGDWQPVGDGPKITLKRDGKTYVIPQATLANGNNAPPGSGWITTARPEGFTLAANPAGGAGGSSSDSDMVTIIGNGQGQNFARTSLKVYGKAQKGQILLVRKNSIVKPSSIDPSYASLPQNTEQAKPAGKPAVIASGANAIASINQARIQALLQAGKDRLQNGSSNVASAKPNVELGRSLLRDPNIVAIDGEEP